MLVFKPRLALFYILAIVIVSVVTNRLSISTQAAHAESAPKASVQQPENAPACRAK